MNQRTNTIPPEVEYHRVLAGEKRRVGRGMPGVVIVLATVVVWVHTRRTGPARTPKDAESSVGAGVA